MPITNPLYTGFIASLILAACISLVLFGYVWHRRSTPCAIPLLGALGAIFFWSLGYILEYTCNDLSTKLFSFNISYVGSATLHLMVLLFALQYCGFGKFITRRRIILLSIIPIITLLLQWTKQYHSLMYYDISLIADGPFLLVSKQYGPWFWVNWIYDYLLLTASIVVLVHRLIRRPHLYARQAVYIIMMIIIPVFANLLYILRFIPIPHADWTPASLAISTIFMALLVFNKQLFEIIPVARESLIDMMSEGFAVTDCKGFVVDFNQSIQKILPPPEQICIGEVLPSTIAAQLNLDYSTVANQITEIALRTDDNLRYYIVNTSPLYARGHKHVGHLFIFHDITERKRTEDIIKRLAYHDQLTTLPNRYLFHDRAALAIEHAIRYKKKMAVIMMDLNGFKEVNDTLGHAAGDKLLQEVALRVIKSVRRVDTVSRFGGDEFVILLTEINNEKLVTRVATRIVQNMTRSFIYNDTTLPVPFSMGISIYPNDSDDLDILMQYADRAMYQARRLGDNHFLYYSPDIT